MTAQKTKDKPHLSTEFLFNSARLVKFKGNFSLHTNDLTELEITEDDITDFPKAVGKMYGVLGLRSYRKCADPALIECIYITEHCILHFMRC